MQKMKEFNLEEAKAGKPVCMKNGTPVRIVSFNGLIHQIIGIVKDEESKSDIIRTWTNNGQHIFSDETEYDLIMAE